MKRQYLFVLSLSLTLSILSVGQAVSLSENQAPAAIQGNSAATKPDLNALAEDYGKLPLSFEANNGQTDARVKFLSRGRGYTLFLTGNEAVLALPKARVAPPSLRSGERGVLHMKLVGVNVGAAATGAKELPGKSNYFIGKDPSKWRTNVPNFAQVKYSSVYPGVDLVYYGSQGGRLEYDFVVAPGADPSAIKLEIAADSGSATRAKLRRALRISPDGDLVARMVGGEIRMHKPVIYQNESAGAQRGGENRRTPREGRFILMASNQVGFALGPYDHAKPLIIDPVLSYSTYLGGINGGLTQPIGIAVDTSGDAYVTGETNASDFPTTSNGFQPTFGNGGDAFITKFAPSGSTLIYSTFLDGSNGSEGAGIAVDTTGAAYVTGYTGSADFPTLNPIQAALGGPAGTTNAFITKLAPSGAALVYSTYYGGSAGTRGIAIAVDTSGDAFVTGRTTGTLTTVNALQPVFAGGGADAFVAKVNPAGSAFIFATYLGGSGDDYGISIAADGSGNAYVTGWTTSTDFPTVAPFQAANGTLVNQGTCFVAKINASGSALAYSTYLGGNKADLPSGIAVDGSGNAYVAGQTSSANFPTQNPLQATNLAAPNGGNNGFITKFNPAGSALVYSTYLGGSNTDEIDAIAIDSVGNVYVSGATDSSDFPSVNPLPQSDGGSFGVAFISEINAAGSALVFSTHFGTNSLGQSSSFGEESVAGIAVDATGNIYLTGQTSSTAYPTLNPFEPVLTEDLEGFVAKFTASAGAAAPTVTIAVVPTTISVGQSANLTWSSTNATSCTASGGWTGTQATSGTASESPTASGNVTYTLTCAGTGGNVQGSATLTVTAVAPTVTISVNPTSITLGQSASLTWSTTNATACTASGAWTGSEEASGTQSVTPTATGNSTYTLTCTGAGGSANASAALTVNAVAAAPTVTLSISTTSIMVGQSAMLVWSSTNATSCTASGAWTGTQATSGTLTITPSAAGASTYTLVCSGAASATAMSVVNLTVTPQLGTVTVLSGKAGGGGLGLWSLLGLALLVAARIRRTWRPALGALAACAVLAALVAPAPVQAQEAASSVLFNWDQTYVGLRAGRSTYWESSGQLDRDLAANGESGTSTSIDQHRIGGVAYVGVPFYKALSLELGFVDLSEYPVGISTTSTNIPQLSQTIIRNLSSAGRALTLNLAAPLDITRWFAIEPRFGILAYQSKQEVYTPLGTFSHDREGGGIDAGLALLLRPTSSIYVGAGVDCFDTGGNRCDVLLYSAEVEFHFGR
jgi:Beta-propeller repeat